MTLATELSTDPLARGYAALLNPYDEAALLASLNTRSYTMTQMTRVTARTVLAQYGASGAMILDKLQAVAAANSTVKWAMSFMTTDGIDVGHPTTIAMIAQLVAAGVLTQAEGDNLNALALVPASRGEVLGLGQIAPEVLRGTVYDIHGTKVI